MGEDNSAAVVIWQLYIVIILNTEESETSLNLEKRPCKINLNRLFYQHTKMRMKVVYVDKSVLFSCIELDEKGGKICFKHDFRGCVVSCDFFF